MTIIVDDECEALRRQYYRWWRVGCWRSPGMFTLKLGPLSVCIYRDLDGGQQFCATWMGRLPFIGR